VRKEKFILGWGMMDRYWKCFWVVVCMSMSRMVVAQSFTHAEVFHVSMSVSPIPIVYPTIVSPKEINPPGYSSVFQLSVDDVHFCTWFMVGEKTMISAAHCLIGGKRNFALLGGLYHATCSIPQDFGMNHSLDLTMCLLDRAFQSVPVDGFERVLKDGKYVKIGKMVEIGGYGCYRAGESVENQYAIGDAKIYKLDPGVHLPGSVVRTPSLIKIKGDPSYLCGGDSGGPVFLTPTNGSGRRVLGVNSATVFDIEASYITSLLTADSRKFIATWSSKNGQRICGLDEAVSGCRP
jgi:hypothetical protein